LVRAVRSPVGALCTLIAILAMAVAPALAVVAPPEPSTYTEPVTVVKYNDLNGNGQQDAGEPGLPNWAFTVYNAGGQVASGNTNANGEVVFNLAKGTYAICETLTSGWENTEPGTINPTYGQPCASITVGQDAGPLTATIRVPNGNSYYRVDFVSKVGTTWTYRVTEIAGSRDLSHWNLAFKIAWITWSAPALMPTLAWTLASTSTASISTVSNGT
jgi:hypothetical protein